MSMEEEEEAAAAEQEAEQEEVRARVGCSFAQSRRACCVMRAACAACCSFYDPTRNASLCVTAIRQLIAKNKIDRASQSTRAFRVVLNCIIYF